MADDPEFRERPAGIAGRSMRAITDAVQELADLQLVADAGVQIRVHRVPPPFKLYQPGTADDGEDQEQSRRKSNGNLAPCTCGCGRHIRVAPTVLDLGAITCSLCGQDFTPTARS